MGRGLPWIGAVIAVLWASMAAAKERPTIEQLQDQADREVEQSVAQADPTLVPKLQEGTRARRNKEWDKAFALYSELHKALPKNTHLTRRLCGIEEEREHRAEAIALCREAASDGDPSNIVALAAVLDNEKGTDAEREEALSLARKALQAAPQDMWTNLVGCPVLLDRKDNTDRPACLDFIAEKAPAEGAAKLLALYAIYQLQGSNSAYYRGRGQAQKDLQRAASLSPNDILPQMALCDFSVKQNSLSQLGECSKKLKELAPDKPQTHLFLALYQLSMGELDEAQEAVDRAAALGARPEAIQDLRNGIEEARSPLSVWGPRILWGLGLWAGGLIALLLSGLGLSHIALRAANERPAESTGRATGMSATLRKVYKAVMALCCVYYYLSIPLIVLAVIAVAGGIIWGIWTAGYIAPKLFILLAVMAFVTIKAIGKNLFVRPRREDPGIALSMEQHPKLKAVLQEVAEKVGTRPVDRVFLTPDAELAVFERGSLMAQMRSSNERCLVLGAGALSGMRLGPFRAILAHEYGHFSNRDTAGGGFALAVRRSILMTAMGLAQAGAATKLNPAWLFIDGFNRLFLIISHGASRLQEVLADRWAAYCYGADNFAEGLHHVVRQGIEFDHHAEAAVNVVAKSPAGLTNLYAFEPPPEPVMKRIEKEISEALTRLPSRYDSHPSPEERIRLVKALEEQGDGLQRARVSADESQEDVWSLISDRPGLEKAMTDHFRNNACAALGIQPPWR